MNKHPYNNMPRWARWILVGYTIGGTIGILVTMVSGFPTIAAILGLSFAGLLSGAAISAMTSPYKSKADHSEQPDRSSTNSNILNQRPNDPALPLASHAPSSYRSRLTEERESIPRTPYTER